MPHSNRAAPRPRLSLRNGCAIAALLVAMPLHAQDVTWTGGTGTWNDPAGWNTGVVPNAAQNAIVDGDAGTDADVTITDTRSIQDLTIGAGDAVTIDNGRTLSLLGGDLDNDGTLTLGSAGATTVLSLGVDTLFSGSGTVALTDSTLNRISGATGTTLTNAAGHTISGSGNLGGNLMGLDNAGLVEAAGTSGLTLQLRTLPDVTRRNSGTLRAATGSTLTITQGIIDNTGGTIEAASGGTVSLAGSSVFIDGGTLTGPGTIDLRNASELRNVANTGSVVIANGQSGEISGTIANAGTIALDSGGSTSTLSIQDDTTLDGTGSVEMSDSAINRITGVAATTLTNTADHTIRGSGNLGGNLIGLDNDGLVEAVGGAGLTLQLRTLDDVTRRNAGTLRADTGSTLTIIQGFIDNSTGVIESAAGGDVSFTGGTVIDGGTLTGPGGFDLRGAAELADVTTDGTVTIANGQTGEISGTIANAGEIALDAIGSTTVLNIRGDTTLAGTGSVEMSDSVLNRITGDTAATLTNTADHTIRGSGNLGGNAIGLDNDGLVEAVGGAGLTLQLRTLDDVTRRNAGVLRATGGSTLSIIQGVIDNSTGVIESASGGDVSFSGGTVIDGGTLTGPGGFDLRGAAELADVTNDGTVTIANAQTGEISGTIANAGTIALASGGSFTTLNIRGGDTTLAGTGSVEMSDSVLNRITGDTAATLTNTADHTIRGSGNLGGNAIGLDNDGLVEAVGGAGLTLQLRTLDDVTRRNAGVLRATGGSTLSIIQGAIDNEGTIEAASGGTVAITGGTTDILGGTLTGPGAFTLSGAAELRDLTNESAVTIANAQTGVLGGNIVNDGNIAVASAGSFTTLNIEGDTTLDGTGTVTLGDNSLNRLTGTTDAILTNAAGHTIRGAGALGGNLIGILNEGLIEADGVAALTVDPRDATGPVVNDGILRASGAGGLILTSGSFDNQGLVEAVDGSSVEYSGSGVTLNNVGGVLTGGQWRAAGAGSTIDIRGGDVTTNAAEIVLSGAGSAFRNVTGITPVALEDTLTDNDGTLRVLANRDFAAANGLTNRGAIELGGGTLSAPTLTNTATGQIFGFGSIVPNVGNSGVVRATGGTLSADAGITAASGTVISEAGATMAIGADSSAEFLDLRGGALALGPHDFTVSGDYTNDAFGTGNGFDARANVTGSGEIIGADADMGTGGDVVAGVLDLGNVRGGTTATRSFTVDNTGTGADIRGAVQTAAGTGNITDARLSGSGVTAQNFGPVAAGGSTASFDVTFEATAGGSLAGQTIGIASNFDNVAGQTISLLGFATARAEGAADPAGPVDLGAFRVGTDGPAQDIAVTNLTAGLAAERLGIGAATTSGNFTATNALGAELVAGGVTVSDAVNVAVAGGVAGVNAGALTLDFTTDGTVIDPTFTAEAANSQVIDVSATGYNVAEAGVTPDPVVIANQRVGGTGSAALDITNIAPDDGFSEALSGGIASVAGDATATGGPVSMLAAGDTDSGIAVGVDTSAAGARSGSVTLGFESDGAGTSGLGTLALADQTVAVSGNVYQVAEGRLDTAPLNFGTVQVGQVVNRTLSITNAATGPLGFVEDLNASFGAVSGTGAGRIIGAGSINGLTAGSTDAAAMTVSVNTATAGSVDGAIAIDYVSAGEVGGVSNGLGELAVGSDSFGVTGLIEALGTVIDTAAPRVDTAQPVDLGAARVGDAALSAALSVTNVATGGDQAALSATIAGSGPVTAAGSFDLLDPGATDDTSLTVGIETAVAGALSGTATLGFVSDASNVGGCAPDCALTLPSQDVTVTGNVYQAAEADITTPTLDFGIVHVGDVVAAQGVGIANTAPVAALNDTLAASLTGTAGGPFTASGAVTGLAAGDTDTAGITATLDTSAAGVFSGTQDVAFASQNPDMADLDLGFGSVMLSAQVNNFANPMFTQLGGDGVLTGSDLTFLLDFGIVDAGMDLTASLGVLNDIFGPADVLGGSFALPAAGDFSLTGFDSFADIAAGDVFGGLEVGFSASTTGFFEDLISLNAFGSNASGYFGAFDSISLALRAEVRDPTTAPIPLPAGVWLLLGGLGGLVAMRRARAA
ncbi:choice-of-anchor D domain-containing protein [Meridianimarinicoccus sp. RP-17]